MRVWHEVLAGRVHLHYQTRLCIIKNIPTEAHYEQERVSIDFKQTTLRYLHIILGCIESKSFKLRVPAFKRTLSQSEQ